MKTESPHKRISLSNIIPERSRSIHAFGVHTSLTFGNTAIKRKSLNMLVFQAFDFRLDLYLHRNFGDAISNFKGGFVPPFLHFFYI